MSAVQQHPQTRKELPKVSKQFPEEFFLQRQRTAQSTLNTQGKVEIDYISEYDPIYKGGGGFNPSQSSNSSATASNANSSKKIDINGQNYNQKYYVLQKQTSNGNNPPQFNTYDQVMSAQNTRRNPSLPFFYQQQSNIKHFNDLQNSQLSRQQSMHGISQNNQLTHKAGIISNSLGLERSNPVIQYNSSVMQIPTIEEVFPRSQQKNLSPLPQQQHQAQIIQSMKEGGGDEEEKRNEVFQDSSDKNQFSPIVNFFGEFNHLNLRFSQQLQSNSDYQKGDANILNCDRSVEGERKRSNGNLIGISKSYSSSSTKRFELRNSNKSKQNVIFSPTLSPLDIKQSMNLLPVNLSSVLTKKNDQFILQTEYGNGMNDNNKILEQNDNTKFFGQQSHNHQYNQLQSASGLSALEQLSNINNSNNGLTSNASLQALSAGIYYNQNRASSSSACFCSDTQGIDSLNFNQIPYIYSANGQNQYSKNLLGKQSYVKTGFTTEANNSLLYNNLNYSQNHPTAQQQQLQLVSGQVQQLQPGFHLPRISILNDINLHSSVNQRILKNDNFCPPQYSYLDKNQWTQPQLNGINKSLSTNILSSNLLNNSKSATNQENTQMFAIDSSSLQQVDHSLKYIKTPSFNPRQQIKHNIETSNEQSQISQQFASKEQQQDFKLTRQNGSSLINLKKKQQIDQNSVFNYQDDGDKILIPKNSQGRERNPNNNNEIILNTSFGDISKETQFQQVNDESAYQCIEAPTKKKIVLSQKKKNLVQQNFKISRDCNDINSPNEQYEKPSMNKKTDPFDDFEGGQTINYSKLSQNSYLPIPNQCLSKGADDEVKSSIKRGENQLGRIQLHKKQINNEQSLSFKIKSEEVGKRARHSHYQQHKSSPRGNEIYTLRSSNTDHENSSKYIQIDKSTREMKLNSLSCLKDNSIPPFNLLECSFQQNSINVSSTVSTQEDAKLLVNTAKQTAVRVIKSNEKRAKQTLDRKSAALVENKRQDIVNQKETEQIERLNLTLKTESQANEGDNNMMFTFKSPQSVGSSYKMPEFLKQVELDKYNPSQQPLSYQLNGKVIGNRNKALTNVNSVINNQEEQQLQQKDSQQELIEINSTDKQQQQKKIKLNCQQEQYYNCGSSGENTLQNRKLITMSHRKINLKQLNSSNEEQLQIATQQSNYEQRDLKSRQFVSTSTTPTAKNNNKLSITNKNSNDSESNQHIRVQKFTNTQLAK